EEDLARALEFGQGGEREIEVGLGQLGVLDRVERAERRIDPAFGQALFVEEALEIGALRLGAALGRGGGEGVAAPVVSGIRGDLRGEQPLDRKSTRLNSSHVSISYA